MAEILIDDEGTPVKVRVDKDKKKVIFDDGTRTISIGVNEFALIANLITITLIENMKVVQAPNFSLPNTL